MLRDVLQRCGVKLAESLCEGVDFRLASGEVAVGDLEEIAPAPPARSWRQRCTQGALEIRNRYEWVDQTVAVRRQLRNTGADPLGLDDDAALLYLRWGQPLATWRHVYAEGGTTEQGYPPRAFTTRESWRNERGFALRCHPAGRSSNLHLPILISLASAAPDSPGLFCAMEWSGDWRLQWGRDDDGPAGGPSGVPGPPAGSCLSAVIPLAGAHLAPGEVLELPAVHVGFFPADGEPSSSQEDDGVAPSVCTDTGPAGRRPRATAGAESPAGALGGGPGAGAAGATNRLRRYLHCHVCATLSGRPLVPPVTYDHWFGIDNRVNEEILRRQAHRAARIGVEIFCVDAAWFPGEFPLGVGNWHGVDAAKFPEGLEPVADHVRSLGMDFGLWFEPESAVEGTDAVTRHPELYVPAGMRGPRRHYHLNLALTAAQDYLIETVGRWIERLDLRWSRWDYNIEPRPFWEAVDPTMKVQFAYMQGLYRVLDTLMAAHPRWMVEQCASGGRRLDLGTMRRAHSYWFSDQTTDPWLCRYMQLRANRFLPAHLAGSSVAVALGQGGVGVEATDLLSRMAGRLAFDGDIASWPDRTVEAVRAWVEEYKGFRGLLVQDVYALLPQPTSAEDWDAAQFLDPASETAVVFVFAGTGGGARRLPLFGLAPEGRYRVERRGLSATTVGVPGRAAGTPPAAVSGTPGTQQEVGGRQLANDGLAVALRAGEGGLWRVERLTRPGLSGARDRLPAVAATPGTALRLVTSSGASAWWH